MNSRGFETCRRKQKLNINLKIVRFVGFCISFKICCVLVLITFCQSIRYKLRISSPKLNTTGLVSCFQAGSFRRLDSFVEMSRIFRFTQYHRNISGGFTGLKEELTARGMGTEMWTERLQEVMPHGRKCTLFLQNNLLLNVRVITLFYYCM